MVVGRVAHVWPDFVTELGMLSFEGKGGGWKGGTRLARFCTLK